MKWSVGTKITAAFAMVLLILIAIGATAFLSTRKLVETSHWVDHTHQVLEKLGTILSLLKDAETGQRGYVLTGEEKYLEPYEAAVPQIDRAIEDVKQLTSAKSFSKPIVTTLEPLKAFYPAEDYHQDYVRNHPNDPYIRMWFPAKEKKLRDHLPGLLKKQPAK